ncbi:MAG: hypothetical protein KDH20_22855 [Rhodocyclaceae bacterium]|nr:hypothetical protein [Rhodocyclaceae bacterium]
MIRKLTTWLVAACVAGGALAQGAPSDEQRRRLIEQKLRLVEMLVNSPAAKSSAYGRDAETPKLVEQGKALLDEARGALADGRLDEAAAALDQALKSASSASRRLKSEGGLSDSAQRKQLADMTEQVRTYRAALDDLRRDDKLADEATQVLMRVDGLAAEANKLSEAGRLGEANKHMADAYKIAVEELSRLRAGQEVVLSLKFDTPADEYAYEQKRFGSNQIMVDMMVGEGRAEGGRRQLVDRFVGEGQRLKREAEGLAESGKYTEAIASMEQATKQLNRALQSMGVPVF